MAQPGQPALVSRQQLANGASSAAEYDPHALLWWPASGLLVLPVDNYSSSVTGSSADIWSIGPAGAPAPGRGADPARERRGGLPGDRAGRRRRGRHLHPLRTGCDGKQHELALSGGLAGLPERLLVNPPPAGQRRWPTRLRRGEERPPASLGLAGGEIAGPDPNESTAGGTVPEIDVGPEIDDGPEIRRRVALG